MINSLFSKLYIIAIWATFSCPFAFSSCNLDMREVKYYFNNQSIYKVNINMAKVCSSNVIYKRKISNIEMNIYKNNKKLLSYTFDNGLWMPSQSKFFLKTKETLKSGCFKGTKALTLNLDSNIINSTKGHYFNLSSGKYLNINCSELI